MTTVGKHEHPHVHVKADHDVRIWYPDWNVGYIHWDYGEPQIYDSKGVEAGDTDYAWCETDGAVFDLNELGV